LREHPPLNPLLWVLRPFRPLTVTQKRRILPRHHWQLRADVGYFKVRFIKALEKVRVLNLQEYSL